MPNNPVVHALLDLVRELETENARLKVSRVVRLICDAAGTFHPVVTVSMDKIDVTTSGYTDVRCEECRGPMVLDGGRKR